MTPLLKAIRAKCLECTCGSAAGVRHCDLQECPLWPFRMGKNPFAKPRGLPYQPLSGFPKNSSQTAAVFSGATPSKERGTP